MPFEINQEDLPVIKCHKLYTCLENNLCEIVDILRKQVDRRFGSLTGDILVTQIELNKAAEKFRITHSRLIEEMKRMLIANEQLRESNIRYEVRNGIADLVTNPEAIECTKRRLIRNLDKCNELKSILNTVFPLQTTRDNSYTEDIENTDHSKIDGQSGNFHNSDDTMQSGNNGRSEIFNLIDDNAAQSNNNDHMNI
ncbi:hypothetical protein GJ496_004838 [Pomphorhynchus laevis]|nr:hypothetical protein GJ496_004838 [Pomphorhynchus laevis]